MQPSNNELKSTIRDYLIEFPKEVESFNLLIEQSEKETDIFTRKNFVGHVTASAVILSHDKKYIFAIHHKILDKMLCPGGHVDEGESPFEAVVREIEEETGFNNLEYFPVNQKNLAIPLDIDTHSIPENAKKNEPRHYHHDFKYCFILKDSANININPQEITDYTWLSLEKASSWKGFERVIQKTKDLLSEI